MKTENVKMEQKQLASQSEMFKKKKKKGEKRHWMISIFEFENEDNFVTERKFSLKNGWDLLTEKDFYDNQT